MLKASLGRLKFRATAFNDSNGEQAITFGRAAPTCGQPGEELVLAILSDARKFMGSIDFRMAVPGAALRLVCEPSGIPDPRKFTLGSAEKLGALPRDRFEPLGSAGSSDRQDSNPDIETARPCKACEIASEILAA